MTPERYRQINALADAALQMLPDQRTVFLNEACGSDRELRQQIEVLLSAELSSSNFLEKPLLEVLAGDMLARPVERDLAGVRIANYEVLSRLGAGGIGEVWLARDLRLDREIALKLLAPKFAGDPYHLHRFQQEARTASALNHPNIITVHEIGEAEGVLFIAEERVVGETIRQLLTQGPISLRKTLQIGVQAAAALGAAHSAGVVHRDIKPENAMLRPDGLLKVLDFGLARFVERAVDEKPSPFESGSLQGLILGTVRYMSPEQARGLPVDGRSDIFSLGVMLYEMAAGEPPFSGPTPTDTLAAILTSDPPPLSRYLADASPEFERIVRRCLAKEPNMRYGSAEELQADLARLATRLARRATPLEPRFIVVACAALVSLTVVFLLVSRREPQASFNSMQIMRLATRGEATDAAISHNGRLLAYITAEGPGQSLWVRDSSGSSERAVVTAESGEHSGVTFSPDDTSLYYRRRSSEGIGDLYRVPVQGGEPKRVLGEVSGAVAFSPDGHRFAFVRLNPSTWEAALIVANADGSSPFTLSNLRRPKYFEQHNVAWSPDGRFIACLAGEGGSYSDSAFRLVKISLADGSQSAIGRHSWSWPRSVAWSSKGDVLIVTAAVRGDDIYQLWTVRTDNGAVNRITNDLSNYDRVTLTNDGSSLVSVENDTSAAIWIATNNTLKHFVRITTTPLRSRLISLAWTTDERILYSDPIAGYRNLSLIDADGKNRKPLTSTDFNKDQSVVSHDGRFIIYKQSGNIWRANSDGTGAHQLTHGSLDVHPDISVDDRSIVYASFRDWSPAIGGEPTLWRIPSDGGQAVEIARQPASYPIESPDGKRLAFVYFPGKDPRVSADQIATLTLDGGNRFAVFESSPSEGTPISWSPGGKDVDYVVNVRGAGNLWRQPTNGGTARQVTTFDADELFAFAWSSKGRLACVRGTTVSSVIQIKNFE